MEVLIISKDSKIDRTKKFSELFETKVFQSSNHEYLKTLFEALLAGKAVFTPEGDFSGYSQIRLDQPRLRPLAQTTQNSTKGVIYKMPMATVSYKFEMDNYPCLSKTFLKDLKTFMNVVSYDDFSRSMNAFRKKGIYQLVLPFSEAYIKSHNFEYYEDYIEYLDKPEEDAFATTTTNSNKHKIEFLDVLVFIYGNYLVDTKYVSEAFGRQLIEILLDESVNYSKHQNILDLKVLADLVSHQFAEEYANFNYHLNIQTPHIQLSSYIRKLFKRFTDYYNKTKDFQVHYYAQRTNSAFASVEQLFDNGLCLPNIMVHFNKSKYLETGPSYYRANFYTEDYSFQKFSKRFDSPKDEVMNPTLLPSNMTFNYPINPLRCLNFLMSFDRTLKKWDIKDVAYMMEFHKTELKYILVSYAATIYNNLSKFSNKELNVFLKNLCNFEKYLRNYRTPVYSSQIPKCILSEESIKSMLVVIRDIIAMFYMKNNLNEHLEDCVVDSINNNIKIYPDHRWVRNSISAFTTFTSAYNFENTRLTSEDAVNALLRLFRKTEKLKGKNNYIKPEEWIDAVIVESVYGILDSISYGWQQKLYKEIGYFYFRDKVSKQCWDFIMTPSPDLPNLNYNSYASRYICNFKDNKYSSIERYGDLNVKPPRTEQTLTAIFANNILAKTVDTELFKNYMNIVKQHIINCLKNVAKTKNYANYSSVRLKISDYVLNYLVPLNNGEIFDIYDDEVSRIHTWLLPATSMAMQFLFNCIVEANFKIETIAVALYKMNIFKAYRFYPEEREKLFQSLMNGNYSDEIKALILAKYSIDTMSTDDSLFREYLDD